MRWSQFYLHTSKEIPKDAEVVSHQLMARAGMIRKLAAGIYSYLPLGWRSLVKMTAIIRREMNAAGAVELSMPAVQPSELWQESGRWQIYGKELLRIRDRHEREFCFGPTHEEVVTDIVRRDIKSYRQLPINLYQIQTKFRDEIRPRFGLMRGREFVMKDAYSFHVDGPDLDETYEKMRQAYCRILESCGLEYTMVEADSGAIGGSSSHEFMVVAETGESAVVRCSSCDYGANVEKAKAAAPNSPVAQAERTMQTLPTPNATSVQEVAALLGVEPSSVVKTLVYESEIEPVVVLVRGDREINQIKLQNLLGVTRLELASEGVVRTATGSPVGFAGPVGIDSKVRLIADESVRQLKNFVCGANRADAHHVDVNWGRDLPVPQIEDLLLVVAGDACCLCEAPLETFRGIEVGHIFKLGDKYSSALNCTFDDDAGASRPMIMGCYGLGVGRTVAAAIEQNHDADGIIWPAPLAPFEVLLTSLGSRGEEVWEKTEAIYRAMLAEDIDVLWDDRDERPGVKFKDADLIGIPARVVVGAKSLAAGGAEVSGRRDRQRETVPLDQVLSAVRSILG